MSAAVRIEAMAFSDERMELLGELAGYNRHEALGRIARLWSYCTDKETDLVEETIIRAHMGLRGVEAIVGAGLAESTPEGVRLRGGERLFWLREKRENARKGGRAKAAKRERGKSDEKDPIATPESAYSSASGLAIAKANPCPIVIATVTGTYVPDKTTTPPAGMGAHAYGPEEPQASPGNGLYGRVYEHWAATIARVVPPGQVRVLGPQNVLHEIRECLNHKRVHGAPEADVLRAIDILAVESQARAEAGEAKPWWALEKAWSPGVLREALTTVDAVEARTRATRGRSGPRGRGAPRPGSRTAAQEDYTTEDLPV